MTMRGVEERMEIEVRRRTAVRMRLKGHSIEAILGKLERSDRPDH